MSQNVITNIRNAFNNLKSKNRFFVSEADFQHSLAIELEKYFPGNVYCEFPAYVKYEDNGKQKLIHIDIMVLRGNDLYPIELKYKTRKIKSTDVDCNTGIKIGEILRTHSAQDINAYEFWKDVLRIERLIVPPNKNIKSGVCIMITNDSIYYKSVKEQTKNVIWTDFLLNDGLETRCNGPKSWHSNAEWTKKYPPLYIKNRYKCKWKSFCAVKDSEFKSLFIEVKRPAV